MSDNNYTYQALNSPVAGGTNNCIKRSDGAIIPPDTSNKDYQKYLDWVADGNTIQDAD